MLPQAVRSSHGDNSRTTRKRKAAGEKFGTVAANIRVVARSNNLAPGRVRVSLTERSSASEFRHELVVREG